MNVCSYTTAVPIFLYSEHLVILVLSVVLHQYGSPRAFAITKPERDRGQRHSWVPGMQSYSVLRLETSRVSLILKVVHVTVYRYLLCCGETELQKCFHEVEGFRVLWGVMECLDVSTTD